jgi:hypothetical protein
MSFEVLYDREGTCACCNGPLQQAYIERLPTWCSNCNVLYTFYREVVKRVGVDHAIGVLQTVKHVVAQDLVSGEVRKPVRTMSTAEYEVIKKRQEPLFKPR